MKWQVESWKAKEARLGKWHRWFAWYPVRISTNGVDTWAWLETVERSMEWIYGRNQSFWLRKFRAGEEPK